MYLVAVIVTVVCCFTTVAVSALDMTIFSSESDVSHGSSDNTLKMSFYRPTPGILPHLTLLRITGPKSRITVHVAGDTLTVVTKLSEGEEGTEISASLSDNMEYLVEFEYKRFIRTLALTVGDQARKTKRLSGRQYMFTPTSYHLYFHPLVCIDSLRFDDKDLLQITNYIGCTSTSEMYELVWTWYNVIYVTERVAVRRVLLTRNQAEHCDAQLVTLPHIGSIYTHNSIAYYSQNEKTTANNTEWLWVLVTCEDNSTSYAQLVELDVQPAKFTTDAVKEIMIMEYETVIKETDLKISRVKSPFADEIPVDIVIWRNGQYGSLLVKNKLISNSSIGRDVIEDGRLVYRVKSVTTTFTDTVSLLVTSSGANPILVNLTFHYLPTTTFSTNQSILVEEDSSAVLTTRNIHCKYGYDDNFSYHIAVVPKHGRIVSLLTLDGLSLFTETQLIGGDVAYVHGGDESEVDFLSITCNLNQDSSIQSTMTVNVKITPINDNLPRRVSPDVIEVVRDSVTLLTVDDLWYDDEDSNLNVDDIVIERQGIFCGDIESRLTADSIFKFTQLDIKSGDLLFRHSGKSLCRLVVWVSDGKHTISDLMELVAVDHVLVISGTRAIDIQQGGSAVIDNTVLSIQTNTKLSPHDITISLNRRPFHGRITLTHLTYQDIIDGRLTYEHLGLLSVYDSFSVEITIGTQKVTELISVSLDTDPSLLLPTIQHNKPILGRPFQTIPLNADYLQAYHSQANPSELQYQVPITNSNMDGGFFVNVSSDDEAALIDFTQLDINSGAVAYTMGPMSKLVTVLVSFRGVSTDIVMKTVVVKDYIAALPEQNITVMEGHQIELPHNSTQPQDAVLLEANLQVEVIVPPMHGTLLLHGHSVNDFSLRNVNSNLVTYAHDGSETTYDVIGFILKHVPTGLESKHLYMFVRVMPSNDNPPLVNCSQHILLWQGEKTIIGPSILSSIDRDSDSSPSAIYYDMMSTVGCIRLVKHDLLVYGFTQQDVNDFSVSTEDLSHTSSCGTEYDIDVVISDGVHIVEATFTFTVLSRQVPTITVYPSHMSRVPPRYLPQFYPNQVLDDSIVYDIEAAPAHGVLIPEELIGKNVSTPLRQFTGGASIVYVPLLTDHLMEKLCRRVDSQWIQDKIVLNAHHLPSTTNLTNQRMHFNISYLHVNAALNAENVTELHLRRGETVTFESKHVMLQKIYYSLSNCRPDAKGGFIIKTAPEFGKLLGLDRHGVVWWEAIMSGNFTYTHNGMYHARAADYITLAVMLQQNGRRHIISDVTITLRLNVLSDDISEQDLLYDSPNMAIHAVSLLQGEHRVAFTLKGSTKPLAEWYLISHSPKYGRILNISDQITTNITSKELVTYEQVDMTPRDSFVLTSNSRSTTSQILVIISVRPNIMPHAPLVVAGTNPIPITEESLDAAPLLRITSDPIQIVYLMTKPPIYGQVKVENASRSRRSAGLSQNFSHQDVINGLVVYYPPDEKPEAGEDNFEYTLTAPGVQPANGVFRLQFSSNYTPSVNKEFIIKSSSNNRTLLTIALASASVILLIIISVIIGVHIKRKHSASRQTAKPMRSTCDEEPRLVLAKENGSYKLLIAGCDDFAITPHSLPPSPSRCIDKTRTSETSPTVPEVRVSPLISADGTCYDLHDYINYDDLLTLRGSNGSQHDAESVTQYSEDLDVVDTSYQEGASCTSNASIENMPPIKKPYYSC